MSSFVSRYIGADRLPRNLSRFDVDVFFRLAATTVSAIKERFVADRHPGADGRRVGLAAQVAFLAATGKPLDNVALIPPSLLQALGDALNVSPPTIATIRSIYKRRKTANDHQKWAREHLELSNPGRTELDRLSGALRERSGDVASVDELLQVATRWLYDQKIIIPGERSLREIAVEAFRHVEQEAIKTIKTATSAKERDHCIRFIFGTHAKSGRTVLEWLKAPPRRHSPTTLSETLEKVALLKGLGAHSWDLDRISMPRQRAYAQAIAARPPAKSRQIKDETQLVEVFCFLRMTLLDLTDSALYQTGRRVADFVRQASGRTEGVQASRSVSFRESLVSIKAVVHDATRKPTERLATIADIVDELGDLAPSSHASVVRKVLTEDSGRVRALLTAVGDIEFQGRANDPTIRQLAELRRLRAEGATELPADFDVPVAKVWREAIEGTDRTKALKALEASVALGLRRALRRGSAWVDHSHSFRERDQMLIPPDEWARKKTDLISSLGLKASADEFLIPLFDLIKAGLAAMAEAERAGALTIDEEGVIHLPALESLPADPEPVQHRTQLFKAIGDVQFPDLLLEVDAHTNFSEVLLGRKAYEEHELIAVYGALISHGTEIDAKSVAAMTPQLDPAHVTSAMRALESPGRLTRAIRRVVEFQQRHPITELWGKGELGSADMMSIDASRSLWTARTDPRRRTFAVGLYTHILDTYGVVHNQPVVLNERQAGPAIEGAVRHNETAATRLKRLAVDTHGYTYAGMTFANLCGFDLCPRLRDLKERKLFLPRKMDVPDGLDLVAVCDVSLLGIRKGWDELLRVAASIATGRTSATIVVKRLGSGDPVFRAADQLGRLLRTVFLCDYFSNAEFRREIHTVLNRGESAHQLQRAVYTGKIAPERGRRRDELMAISGSHALLTNAVVAWNTHRMQVEVDRRRKARQPIDDIWLARMGPLHFGHINFRGTFRFGIDRYRAMLINPRRTSVRRVSA